MVVLGKAEMADGIKLEWMWTVDPNRLHHFDDDGVCHVSW